MDIRKTVSLQASPDQVWAFILDPQRMSACVPGVQSVEVISADEYVTVVKVKISFVTATFKIRTTIDAREAPWHLACSGQGEDSGLASKLKHQTQVSLEPGDLGATTLTVSSKLDVMGRVGSFGLSAMKTKVDRLWDEFCEAIQSQLASPSEPVVSPA